MPRSIARAASFDNPDHVAIVIHNYRWRLDLAEGEPKYDDLEKRLAEGPVITVPTITLEGDANGAPHPVTRVPMPRNSRANMRTGPSMVASGTICPKKLRKPLPRPSSMSTPSIDLSRHRNGGHDHEATFIYFRFGASRTWRGRHRGICRTCFVFRRECTHEVSHHEYCQSGRQFDRRIHPEAGCYATYSADFTLHSATKAPCLTWTAPSAGSIPLP